MHAKEYTVMWQVEQTHWWFAARRLFVENVFARMGIKKGNRLCIADIGAGTGGMELFLRQYGNVVGVEPNPEGRKYAKKRNIVLKSGFADKTGLPSNSFDIVCFFDVLYHQGIDEDSALEEAYRVLKPGGMLVITDCAFPFLHSPHDIRVMGRTRYTKSSLSAIVLRNKLQVQYVSYTFFLLFPIVAFWRIVQRWYWLWKRELPEHSDVARSPWLLNFLFPFLCQLETPGYGKISYPWGSSIILVSQKV